MLIATIVIWSLNFTVTRYVLQHGFHPLAYSTVRYGIAATLFAAFTYGYEGSFRVRRRDLVPLVELMASHVTPLPRYCFSRSAIVCRR